MAFQIAFRPYARPFRYPLRTARGVWRVRRGFIVRVVSERGVGFGEVAPIPEFGTESVEAADAFLADYAAVGEVSGAPGAPDARRFPASCFGISAALAAAQGPAQEEADIDGSAYAVAALLPAGPTAVERVDRALASGYRVMKWKIGTGPTGEALEWFRALARRVGDRARLRLDANGALEPLDLRRWLEASEAFPELVEFIEQPLPPGREAEAAELAEGYGTPLALDESLNAPEAASWLRPGSWSGPLVVKPLLMGDVAVLLDRLRPVAGQVVYSSVFETGVGLGNALDLMDALPAPAFACGFGTTDAFADDLNPVASRASLSLHERARINPEAIWRQL